MVFIVVVELVLYKFNAEHKITKNEFKDSYRKTFYFTVWSDSVLCLFCTVHCKDWRRQLHYINLSFIRYEKSLEGALFRRFVI